MLQVLTPDSHLPGTHTSPPQPGCVPHSTPKGGRGGARGIWCGGGGGLSEEGVLLTLHHSHITHHTQ